jgi:hypothetical protein
MSSPKQHTPNQDRGSAPSESGHTIGEPDDPDYREAMMFNTLASMNSELPSDQQNTKATAAMLSLAMQHGLAAYDRQESKERNARSGQPQSSTGALIDRIVKESKERNARSDQPQSSTGALIDQIVKESKERNARSDQPPKSIAQRRDDVARSRSQSRERDHSGLDNGR